MAVDAWTIRTLAQLAGTGPARRLMLAAESLDRDEALACGLADRAGTLDDAVAWAHEIATLAPLSLAHNKLILNGCRRMTDAEASFRAVWASEDVREAADGPRRRSVRRSSRAGDVRRSASTCSTVTWSTVAVTTSPAPTPPAP